MSAEECRLSSASFPVSEILLEMSHLSDVWRDEKVSGVPAGRRATKECQARSIPRQAQFHVTSMQDPAGCTNNGADGTEERLQHQAVLSITVVANEHAITRRVCLGGAKKALKAAEDSGCAVGDAKVSYRPPNDRAVGSSMI